MLKINQMMQKNNRNNNKMTTQFSNKTNKMMTSMLSYLQQIIVQAINHSTNLFTQQPQLKYLFKWYLLIH
jgi:hypothetical protein